MALRPPYSGGLQLVLPGEAHAAEKLEAVAKDDLLAFPGGGLGHPGRLAAARVVLGDGQRGEIGQRPGPLDRDVHVRGLVLDRLEGTDRHAELDPLLHVRDGQVQDAPAAPDGGDRQAHQGQVGDTRHQVWRVNVSYMQGRVEGGDRFGAHLRAADHHHATAGDQRDLVRPVGIQDKPPGAVEHPGARARGQPAGQRREPGGRGEERSRVGDVPEFLKHDGQLHRRSLQPAQIQVGGPELFGGQRPRLGHGLADHLLEQPLVLVELKLHGQPPTALPALQGGGAFLENNILGHCK